MENTRTDKTPMKGWGNSHTDRYSGQNIETVISAEATQWLGKKRTSKLNEDGLRGAAVPEFSCNVIDDTTSDRLALFHCQYRVYSEQHFTVDAAGSNNSTGPLYPWQFSEHSRSGVNGTLLQNPDCHDGYPCSRTTCHEELLGHLSLAHLHGR